MIRRRGQALSLLAPLALGPKSRGQLKVRDGRSTIGGLALPELGFLGFIHFQLKVCTVCISSVGMAWLDLFWLLV